MVPSALYVWDADLNGGVGGFAPLGGPGGVAFVRQMGPVNAPRTREFIGVTKPANASNVQAAELFTATWLEAENVTEITVTATLGTTSATTVNINDGAGIYISFDASNDSMARNWLSEATFANGPSGRCFVPLNVPRKFSFSGFISRADVIGAIQNGTDDIDVILEAS